MIDFADAQPPAVARECVSRVKVRPRQRLLDLRSHAKGRRRSSAAEYLYNVLRALILTGISGTSAVAARQAPQPVRAPDAVLASVQAAVAGPDGSAADTAVSKALAQYPSDPNLHNLAGVVSVQRGATKDAEQHFRQAIELAPLSPAAYENLGRLYQEEAATRPEAAQSAIDVYRSCLEIAQSNSEARYQLAFLLTNAGSFEEGLAVLERLPPDLLSRPHVAVVRVAALQGTRQTDRAAGLARLLAEDPGMTESDVLRVLPAFQKAPSGDAARVLLDGLSRRSRVSADTLRSLAAIKRHEGDLQGARDVLERAAAATQPNATVLRDLAELAYRQRDFDGALGYLAHARTLEPSNAGIHFFFGIVCIELNLGREAYDSLKKALELDLDNPSINYAFGSVALRMHERGEALPYFERYVQLVPGDPRGRFALGVAYFHTGDLERAKEVLTEASTREETAGGAHYYLARISRQQNELDAALSHIREALQHAPENADALAELGSIYTRQGQFEQADATLLRALALDQNNYAATLSLTALYTRTRDSRKEQMAAKLDALQKGREDQAQEFLRIIQVAP